MRVLHIMASGAVGGGLDQLIGLLPELARAGVDCAVAIGPDGPGGARLGALGLETSTIDLMGPRFDPRAVIRMGRWLYRHRSRSDLIHCHGTRAAFFATLASLQTRRAPMVYTAHGLSHRQELAAPARSLRLGAEAVVGRGARQVITVSAADRAELVRRRFVGADRCHHIPNAVDTARFKPGDRAAARSRTGLPAAGFIVGTVARLVPQKAIGDLVAAVEVCPDVTLVIAGDGPERGSLGARAMPLGDRVRFLGVRDDVPELLRALDLFVLSSRWEGEPVALIEAMATGLACIATGTTGSRELLGEGAGVLVEVGAPAALARAINELRAASDVRAGLGDAARRAVAWRSFEQNAARVAAVYERALGPEARPVSKRGR